MTFFPPATDPAFEFQMTHHLIVTDTPETIGMVGVVELQRVSVACSQAKVAAEFGCIVRASTTPNQITP